MRNSRGLIKEWLYDVTYALWHTFRLHLKEFFIPSFITGFISKKIVASVTKPTRNGLDRLLSVRLLSKIAVDGAFISGPIKTGWAKYAIRKGLPGLNEKTMGVETNPHLADDFSGPILEGYGKGIKELVFTGNAIIKVGNKRWIGKVNIHEHWAERAGYHVDMVAEGVKPGTPQVELRFLDGKGAWATKLKGLRYALISPKGFLPNQRLISQMKDQGLVLSKPNFILKDRDWLQKIENENKAEYVVEWKADGSLANVVIHNNRAVFRSHRDTGQSYYDQLPALEWLGNRSKFFICRKLFPGPDQEGTVLKGELFHEDGASKVSGILNSLPENAIRIQQERGPVRFYAWDLIKYKGKDVSSYEYSRRRELLDSVIKDIRKFNRYWDVVPSTNSSFTRFYDAIIRDRRGNAFSEGVVVKRRSNKAGDTWYKIKARDTVDARVVLIEEGIGKRAGTVGRFLVETEDGKRSYVGSFNATDTELKWIWRHRKQLIGDIGRFSVQHETDTSLRAPVFDSWHPDKATVGNLMYNED